MSLVELQKALADLTKLVTDNVVIYNKRSSDLSKLVHANEIKLDKRLNDIAETFANQNSSLKLEVETLTDNTKKELTVANVKIDKEAEIINEFITNQTEAGKLLALDSRINHSTSQMKAADLELSTRSCCIYGLPGTSDTEIDDAFLAIFSSALETSNPNSPFNRNIK